jgi:hypothetical protein
MMEKVKPYVIPKQTFLEAWTKVKANKGSHGIDQQSIETYEENLKDNLFKLWNRMSSGSYFPPPVRAVEIPKAQGGKRLLGIPTVTINYTRSQSHFGMGRNHPSVPSIARPEISGAKVTETRTARYALAQGRGAWHSMRSPRMD